MQSALDAQSIFLDTLRSTTGRHLPHIAMELRPAATKTSASQLEAHIQAATAQQLPENRDGFEQSACHAAEKGP
jgi:hypothetical protein